MNIEYFYHYDAETIANLLMDAEFLTKRSKAVGEKSINVDISELANKTQVKMHIEKEMDLPHFLKKIWNPLQKVAIEETWQLIGSSYIAHATYDVGDDHVQMTTDTIVKNTDEGCSIFGSITVKVKVPVVGKQIEKFIVHSFVTSVDDAFSYFDIYLKE